MAESEKIGEKSENLLHNMSSEEFQSKLYVWFEEKGVLSELRTHLRHQMIEALKSTEIGRKVAATQKLNLNLSPKYQALNLIIAEYLLQQGYHYTLSVFSSEVPMLSALPKFIRPAQRTEEEQGTAKDTQHMKFHERDVWDILEALGLPIECEEAQTVYSAYQSDMLDDTLLVCLMRLLPPALRKKEGLYKPVSTENLRPDTVEQNKEEKISAHKEINGKIPLSEETSIDYHVSKKMSKSDERRNFKEKRRKKQNAYDLKSDRSKSAVEQREDDTDSGKSSEYHIDPDQLEHIMSELHDKMQKAFDHELEIARQEEWQKCRHLIETKEREVGRELEQERAKIKRTEQKIREKMQRELEMEKMKAEQEQEMREIELERKVARELEVERYKILNEYKQILLSKGGETQGVSNSQQDCLGAALNKVQHQSDRLKKKEDLLNKRLKELEINLLNKYSDAKLSVSKETNDAASQCGDTEENIILTEERRTIEKMKSELEELRRKLDTEPIVIPLPNSLYPKKDLVNKEVQTQMLTSRDSQTDEFKYDNSEIQSSPRIVSEESNVPPRSARSRNVSTSQSKRKHKPVVFADIQDEFGDTKDRGDNNASNNSGPDLNSDRGNPLNYVLKSLHHENTYLKAFTSQQRQQIQELISKQVSMGHEVSEANAQVQELSAQLADLSRIINKTSAEDLNGIKSAPVTLRRKKTVRELMSGRAQHKECDHTPQSLSSSRGKGLTYHKSERAKSGDRAPLVSSSDESGIEKTQGHRNGRSSSSKKVLRKPSKKAKPKAKDEDDASPTDEVLTEARKRLKMLEMESEAVDRSYQEFKTRQTENLIDSINTSRQDKSFCGTKEFMTPVAFQKSSSYTNLNFHTTHARARDISTGFSKYRTLESQKTPGAEIMHQVPFNERVHQSSQYNTQRRVHEPTMNIDKNILLNYIAANKIRQYDIKNSQAFSKFMIQNSVKRNVTSTSMENSKFTGTTAFLLKRMEHCTTNFNKFTTVKQPNLVEPGKDHYNNMVKQQRNNLTVSSPSLVQKNVSNESQLLISEYLRDDPNPTVNGYEKYIGKSNEQYKIKPSLNWKNVLSAQKSLENSVKSDLFGTESQAETLLNGNTKNVGLDPAIGIEKVISADTDRIVVKEVIIQQDELSKNKQSLEIQLTDVKKKLTESSEKQTLETQVSDLKKNFTQSNERLALETGITEFNKKLAQTGEMQPLEKEISDFDKKLTNASESQSHKIYITDYDKKLTQPEEKQRLEIEITDFNKKSIQIDRESVKRKLFIEGSSENSNQPSTQSVQADLINQNTKTTHSSQLMSNDVVQNVDNNNIDTNMNGHEKLHNLVSEVEINKSIKEKLPGKLDTISVQENKSLHSDIFATVEVNLLNKEAKEEHSTSQDVLNLEREGSSRMDYGSESKLDISQNNNGITDKAVIEKHIENQRKDIETIQKEKEAFDITEIEGSSIQKSVSVDRTIRSEKEKTNFQVELDSSHGDKEKKDETKANTSKQVENSSYNLEDKNEVSQKNGTIEEINPSSKKNIIQIEDKSEIEHGVKSDPEDSIDGINDDILEMDNPGEEELGKGSKIEQDNETVASEELIVPSSIDLSEQSGMSVPQASDDEDESFWN